MDLIAAAPDTLLVEFGLRPSACTTIAIERSAVLEQRLVGGGAVRLLPGGCGANQAAWLPRLGTDARIVAPFGHDNHGALARMDLEQRGVRVVGFDYAGPHSVIYTLIADGGERTFADYCHGVPYDLLPAARALADEAIVAIDGYLLLRPGAADGVLAYLRDVAPAGQQILFCPGDVSVLADAADACAAILERADHLVVNHHEAEALFPGMSEDAAVDALRARGKAGAITLGERGAILFNADQVFRSEKARLDRPIANTNGAGDAFTAGYLHGVDKHLPLAEIAAIATDCAAQILVREAARPDA